MMNLIYYALFGVSCLQIYADNNRFFWDDWSTHQPVLYATASVTKGPIIEFGCGYGSTDLLHEICEKEKRILITLDDDLEWLSKFTARYEGHGYNRDNSGWHMFFHVPGKNPHNPDDPSHWIKFLDECKLLNALIFDVCFVDQSPWLARFETIKRMKNAARFLVIHDVDFFPMNGLFGKVIKPIIDRMEGEFDFSDTFLYSQIYYPTKPWRVNTGPPTLLGSNFESEFPPIDYSKKIEIP